MQVEQPKQDIPHTNPAETVEVCQQPDISSEESKEILEQVTAEEKFPTKPIHNKPAVFVEYDPTTAQERLQNFSKLQITERITYTKHLAVMLEELGDPVESLLDKLFAEMIQDKEEVQRALLGQIPGLIKFFSQLQNSESKLKQHIIPLIVKMLQLPQGDIKEEAGNCLSNVAYLIEGGSRGESVLKNVLEMAHDDANEDNRVVAVQLFSKMAALFGKDLCEQFIGLQFKSLGQDPNLKVRKQAIIHLPSIGKVVGEAFFKNKLFEFYQKKAKESHWGIRKSCVDTIIQISKLCERKLRQVQLTNIMLEFLKDLNKWVRNSAYKQLGPFIHTLKGGDINQKLVQQYIRMTSNDLNDISTDNDILYACAYNFPAVLDALGKARWNLLNPVYVKLLKIQDKKIKKTLASSLHQVSKILGEKGTKDHLFVILDKFLKDPMDDIKVEAIRNLSHILSIIDAERREELVDIFMILQKDQKKWRIRECIATQIASLAEIYSLQTVFVYLLPITFKFCSDPVSIVRDEAALQIGNLVKKFNSTQQGRTVYLSALIQNIKGFASFTKFTQRETFVTMCKNLLEFQQLAEEHFLPLLIELARDKIINVRISVAKLVASHVRNQSSLVNSKKFQQLLEAVKKDENKDVLDELEEGS